MFKAFLSILFLTLFTATGLVADERVDKREENQKARIVDGIQDGSLTKGETRSLVKEQKRIHRAEKRALSDGELSTREKVRLERKQDRASRHIARQKHDGQMQGKGVLRKTDRRQKRRIARGVKSGEITRGEAKHLVRGQKKIHRAERRAMRDGKISKKEGRALKHAKKKQSRKIYRAKHNKRTRK